MTKDDPVSVRVALRIRPMLAHETAIACQPCISEVPGEPQVVAGGKEFTYDYVFGSATGQSPIFDNCVTPLLDKFFAGYNCTILAYGQTGAGKTHTMGTADTSPCTEHNKSGVIPRIIHELFSRIADSPDTNYRLKATYLEILNEEVKDLLTGNICQNAIRENHDGSIVIHGLKEEPITSVNDLYDCLKTGSENRAVAGHALNAQSSRSHAVFALILEQQQGEASSDTYLISKFNLVDLAGSERAKRTKASGERLKEGININKGLLALGNVISALGDPERKTGYVPYRDSKITRLLQDSLGGNSLTLMIACCSPADSNLEETVNTLRYADRARKIKNKAIVNRDPKIAELLMLRKENAELKANIINNGSNVDVTELNSLRQQVETLKSENEALLSQLRGSEHSTTEKLTKLAELLTVTQIERDTMRDKLLELQQSGVIPKDDSLDESGLGTSLNESQDQVSADEALRADTARREIGEKLQALSEQLNSHEQYAKSLQQNDETFTILREQYQNNVASLNSEISDLNNQKTELENKIKELEKGPGNKKLIQQKSETLTRLQNQISELQAKCRENERLLKIKKGNDKELQKLTKEIQEMKKQRVDLLKNMRAENKKFQQFKNAKNKEIVQIKRFEEKKRADLYKQAAAQQRTANVMKRRYEEAQTMNKRLKETMEKQQRAMSKRVGPGKSVDVKGLLKGHIDIRITKEMAREAIDMFIEQRKKLHDSLQALKKLPKSGSVSEDIVDVERQIKFKTQQISSLQGEVMKSEQSANKNDIFKQLNNIGDCKTGLKWLCTVAVDNHLRENALKRELEIEDTEKTRLQEEIAAVELNFEDSKRQAEEREIEIRKEFQMTIRTLEVQNKRLKSLRTNQPAAVKAKEVFRRQFVRNDSFGSLSEVSDAESNADVDDSWYEDNKDIVEELENVGLKTPRSVKKVLKRRTTRLEKTGCGCKGNCTSKQCGCVKLDGPCGSLCKCNVERCKNRPDKKDPDLEISLEVPKVNLMSAILESDEDWDKENMSGNVSDDSDFELLKNKRKPSKEETEGKKKLKVGGNKR